MDSINDFFDLIISKITLYENHEKREIAFLLIEKLTGLNKTDVLVNKQFDLGPINTIAEKAIDRINAHEPIQYVIEEADFFGWKFHVNSNVLIPRQETEELVNYVIKTKPKRVLDLGTGSGCIAISIDLQLKESEVYGVDISENALQIAERNKLKLNSNANFLLGDILNFKLIFEKRFDVIVSNPPYVKNSENTEMQKNVLDFEPHLALFVDDNDPLLFYRKISEIGQEILTETGKIWVEINSALGEATANLFKNNGYKNVTLIKDINGKDRIVFAEKN